MAGRYCRLEPVSCERHEADLFSAYSQAPDGRDWTYLFSDRPDTAQAFHDYLAKAEKSEDPLHFAIVDTSTHKPAGTAALMRIEPTHGVIEVGSITFSPLLKKTRAATEAMFLLMRRAFDELGYRRYEWKCNSLNAPSRAAALRYGFQYEGLFRQAQITRGRNRDTTWFSIIDNEWPALRGAFERWLDPANFDALGRQRHSLASLRSASA
jgi:RimJ/RimL family protein N-acetyltransferase